MSTLVQQLWSAFLLREEAYTRMRDDLQPLQRGLILVLVVGVAVGVISAWSQLAEWALSPNMNDMQNIIHDHLTKMPWYTEQSHIDEFRTGFERAYELGWQIAKAFAPSPFALSNIIVTPLTLLIMWWVYGLLAHLSARLLGGQGDLGQTLGCTALAVAPQLLNLVLILPFASVAGIGTWTLACNFMAIRAAHGLAGWRALAATLLPLVVLGLVGAIFACGGFMLMGAALPALIGGEL